MSNLRSLVLAVLLVLVVVSFAGHLLAPGDGNNHAASESTCTFHAGFLAPEIPGTCAFEMADFSILGQNVICVLRVFSKIPHPPTN